MRFFAKIILNVAVITAAYSSMHAQESKHKFTSNLKKAAPLFGGVLMVRNVTDWSKQISAPANPIHALINLGKIIFLKYRFETRNPIGAIFSGTTKDNYQALTFATTVAAGYITAELLCESDLAKRTFTDKTRNSWVTKGLLTGGISLTYLWGISVAVAKFTGKNIPFDILMLRL